MTKTRTIPASEAGYGRGSGWQAQYLDPDMGIWFDIGDPQISQRGAHRREREYKEEHG